MSEPTAAKEKAPIVAPRKDQKHVEIYAISRANELAGKDPNAHYEYKSLDPKNPSYHGRFERRHEIGNQESGFATCEPWEFVSATDGVTQGRPRDDQGKPVDTALRHGDLVLMRTTLENAATYVEIDNRKDQAKTKRLAADESQLHGAKHTHRFGAGFSGTHTDLLNQTQQG